MNTALFATFFVLTVWYSIMKYKRAVHMLQQNSYRNERYDRWMRTNVQKVYNPIELGFVLGTFLLLISGTAGLLVNSATVILLFIFRKKEVQKKALAVTDRVKRLFVTLGIVVLLPTVALGILGALSGEYMYVTAFLAFATILAFGGVKLANTINAPIEKRINNFYLNDGKTKVQSMRNLKVIGITGSYGKTSVKNVVGSILGTQFNTLITPESYNTPMGVTITSRRDLNPTHEVYVVEMGAKQKGDIEEICELVQQKYAILTAIGPQHLETFGSLETVQSTKYEIVETLPEDGIAFLNWDDANIRAYNFAFKGTVVKYGLEQKDVDFWAEDATYNERGATFTFASKTGERVSVTTKLLGEHNILNIVAGMSVGATFGIPLEKMASAVRKLKPVKHRLELIKKSENLTIIDNSFNSNPEGSRMSLNVLSRMPGKKVIITPGMIELGERSFELNKAFGKHAAEVCDLSIFVGKKQTLPLQEGAKEAGATEQSMYVATDLWDAMNYLQGQISGPTYVLLENDLPDSFNE
ncbi:MAG: UDP-N-acetylmuramoyl-tripeptide--D-alanyl-D-alanine ligase [Bacilli bacterium]